MKWLKKVAATPLTSIARVIDSLDNTVNERTNAPSIRAVRDAVSESGRFLYPVGSIYMSVNNVNPHDIFGGTWVQIKDKFILAAGDTYANGSTGGSATNTLSVANLPSHTHSYTRATAVQGHTLTVEEMPSHTHSIPTTEASTNVASGSGGSGLQYNIFTPFTQTGSKGGDGAHTHGLTTDTPNTGASGSGTAVNNMPPYLSVNVWYRTA